MISETFGKRICRLRKTANLTQRDLASILGISEPAICKWENDNSMPDVMLLVPLARALHTDLNSLFSYEEILSTSHANELINTAEEIGLSQGIKEELLYWKHLMQEYPNSDFLKLNYIKKVTKLQIQGNHLEGIESIEPMLLSLKNSTDSDIKENAQLYLVSFYIRNQRFKDAQTALSELSNSDFNARHLKTLYLYETKDYLNGLKESEQFLLECAQNLLICLSHMSEFQNQLGNKELALFYAKTMSQIEHILHIPFYRAKTTLIMQHIRNNEFEQALYVFDSYVTALLNGESTLKHSPFWAEIYPETKYISNGTLVSFSDFREELINLIKTPTYMSKIRHYDQFKKICQRLD